MKSRIHVNRHVIAKNKVTGSNDPALSIVARGKTRRAHEVLIDGPTRVIYRPDKPLHCGATAWIETDSPVQVLR